MKTILVATDLSERSDIALKRAVFLARKADALVHVLHVVDGELPEKLRAAQREEAVDIVMGRLAVFQETAGRVKTKVTVVFGDPTEEIMKQATDAAADLVVIGRHRNRGFVDFFLGTTIERLARTTTLPLLVASRAPAGAYDRAVVGIDFSKCAIRAVSLGADLVGARNLSLIHAYHVPFKGLTMRTGPGGAMSDPDRKRVETGLRREVDAWVGACGQPIVSEDVHLTEGSAIEILPRVAADRGADLICVGAHSRSWLQGALLGSTTTELLSYSDLDVLIAPL